MSRRNSQEQKRARRAEREAPSLRDIFPIDRTVDDDMDTLVFALYDDIECGYGMRGPLVTSANADGHPLQFANRYPRRGNDGREVIGMYAPGATPECVIQEVTCGVPADEVIGMDADDLHSIAEDIRGRIREGDYQS